MMIHSDSFVGVMLPFVVALAVVVLVLTSVGMLAFGKFRRGAKALRASAGLVAVYVVVMMAVSLLPPWNSGFFRLLDSNEHYANQKRLRKTCDKINAGGLYDIRPPIPRCWRF
jgi:NADH:ubiquinone oxidoreductase subunit 6 (subunit J)